MNKIFIHSLVFKRHQFKKKNKVDRPKLKLYNQDIKNPEEATIIIKKITKKFL